MNEELTAEDKRVVAKKTGYSLTMINDMLVGRRKMQPVVKRAIEEWIKSKQQFINK